MTQPTELEPARRISRRTVVKGGLVAGGALWVAPVVTGLGITSAHADATSGRTPPPSGFVAPSYVMLVLSDGTNFFSVKIGDTDSSATCTDTPNSGGGGGAALQNAAFTSYASKWSLNETICSTYTIGVSTSGGLTVTLPNTLELVGFMVHDGSYPGNGGSSAQVAFAGDDLSPITFTGSLNTFGSQLVFKKPN